VSTREKSSPARLIMLDLIAFVLMASAMGLIAAITLAAVALLFASQAQASEIREGTLIVRRATEWVHRLEARGGTEMAAALHLALDGRDDVERVPDLYAGEPVIIKAALADLAGEVHITGVRGGRTWEARVRLAAHRGAAGMGTLWAREKVSALLDSIRDGAPEEAVRDEVIRLASAHRLVTRYTSFVAVDATPARASDAPLKRAALPTHLPQGWEYDKVFGPVQGELPQGATGSGFALLSGLLALLLGMLTLLAIRGGRPA